MTTMAGRVCLQLLLLLSAVCLINAKAYPKLVAKRQHHCPLGESKCPTSDTCIKQRYFCDTDNDCGDNSDENTAFCAARQCSEDEVRCPNGQCFTKEFACEPRPYAFTCADGTSLDLNHCPPLTCEGDRVKCPSKRHCIPRSYLCDGDNDCGDNWDESDCALSPERSAEVCKGKVAMSCYSEIMASQSLMSSPLTFTDLKEPCRLVQGVYECVMTALNDQCTESDRQILLAGIAPVAIDVSQIAKPLEYVCVHHIDVFNDNLACIEAMDDSGFSKITLGVMMSCRQFINTEEQEQLCTSQEMINCVSGVVSEQCGAEIGGHVKALAAEVMKVFPSCQTELAVRGFRELLRRKLQHP